MSHELIQLLLCSGLSALGSSFITVISLKNDVKWIKEKLEEHHDRIYNLERA